MQGKTPQPEEGQGAEPAQEEKAANPAAVLEQENPAVRTSDPANSAKRRRYWEAFKDRGFSRTMEALITVATVVNVWVAIEQRDAMEDANRRADRAIDEARRANKIALDALVTGKQLAEIERQEAAEGAKTELEEIRRQSEAGQGLTRQTISDSRRSFEIANRARLGVEDVSRVRLQEGVVFVAYITIRNTGKIPAATVHHSGRMEIWTRPFPDDRVRTFVSAREYKVDLGAGLVFTVESSFPALDKKTVEDIKSGKTPLYFFGRATYDDGFGQRRSLGFCNTYVDAERPWQLCREQNWAD